MPSAKHTIKDLPIGSRILYRSKENWRTAAVSRFDETSVTLTVCSPTGRTYRLKRMGDAEICFEGALAILLTREFENEDWKENFGGYDRRW
jgi:hypothetical protein